MLHGSVYFIWPCNPMSVIRTWDYRKPPHTHSLAQHYSAQARAWRQEQLAYVEQRLLLSFGEGVCADIVGAVAHEAKAKALAHEDHVSMLISRAGVRLRPAPVRSVLAAGHAWTSERACYDAMRS